MQVESNDRNQTRKPMTTIIDINQRSPNFSHDHRDPTQPSLMHRCSVDEENRAQKIILKVANSSAIPSPRLKLIKLTSRIYTLT